jgi:hypothetical protein
MDLLCDARIGVALPAQENHARSQREGLSRLGTPRPTLQRLPFLLGQTQRWNGAASAHLSYSFVQETRSHHYLLRGLQRQDTSGLRQTCPQTCIGGPWPSALNPTGTGETQTGEPPVAFATDWLSWEALDKVKRGVERDAKQGQRVEIRVTALGQVRAADHRSPVGPCDAITRGHYGHMRHGAL